MDLLDPLEISGANDDEQSKAMIQQTLNIDEHSMESDCEDARVVEHLSPQTLLETPQDDVQYSFRTAEGTLTYGVLKVEDDSVPQIIGTNFTNAGVQQVLTGNINGQLYVIGNPGDILVSNQTGTTRAIAPRSTIIETTTAVNSTKKKDERRRATHNEVERRRRDKINNWISKLSKLIPENTSPDMKGNGHYDGQSKGGILAKACEYIVELRDSQTKVDQCLKENKRLSDALDALKHKNMNLDRENKVLRDILKQHGIEVSNVNV